MKTIISSLVFLTLTSCAHKHGKSLHHHHSGKAEIVDGDHGHGKYMIKDRDEVLYFDTEKAFLEYEEQIKARQNRSHARGRAAILFVRTKNVLSS
jgi:hypothetical protein